MGGFFVFCFFVLQGGERGEAGEGDNRAIAQGAEGTFVKGLGLALPLDLAWRVDGRDGPGCHRC